MSRTYVADGLLSGKESGGTELPTAAQSYRDTAPQRWPQYGQLSSHASWREYTYPLGCFLLLG